MKLLATLLLSLVTSLAWAADPVDLSADTMKAKVTEITEAQNAVMMGGSRVADVERLFSLYTEDFTYVHEVYGGTYSRDELHGNTVRALKNGVYRLRHPRYRIVSMIPGHNAIAVQREETHEGKTTNHLAVFEFSGDKVSKIVEYWK